MSPKSKDYFAGVRAFAFYFLGILLLLTIWNTWLVDADFLSDSHATQIGHNSEGFLFALLLCAWIQWVLPWTERRGITIAVSVAAAVASVLIGLWLEDGPVLTQYATLNEAMFGLAFVLAYIPLFRWDRLAPLFSLAVVIALFLGSDTSVVIKGAEYWLIVVLAPLSLSVFDRTILNADAEESHALRLSWMAFLIVVPALSIALDGRLSGDAEGIRAYLSRTNEAFLGLLIVHAYFGYWMRGARAVARRDGRRADDGLGGRQETRRPLASEIDSHDEVYSDRAVPQRPERA